MYCTPKAVTIYIVEKAQKLAQAHSITQDTYNTKCWKLTERQCAKRAVRVAISSYNDQCFAAGNTSAVRWATRRCQAYQFQVQVLRRASPKIVQYSQCSGDDIVAAYLSSWSVSEHAHVLSKFCPSINVSFASALFCSYLSILE